MKATYLAAATLLQAGVSLGDALSSALSACDTVSKKISSKSQVYYAASPSYLNDISHWMSSSMQSPACVVEVGSTEDTAAVMKVIASTKTPFAVKSGGHSSNQGFSSTKGIHISMARLNQVTLSSDKSQVTVGLGNVWTDVYSALDGTGRGVNGGRVPGPGTGGFSLGGGYSWTTNQYGLTCDSVATHTLVLPNGTITTTKPGSDLSFALRGGLNRFGVVTDITYNTYDQGDVYGGLSYFATKDVPAVIKATSTFAGASTDPRAQVILTINSGGPATPAGAILLQLFNGPQADGIKAFAPYDAIKPLFSTVKEQSFSSFAQSTPSKLQAGKRGAFHTMMTTKLTTNFMNAVFNETQYYASHSTLLGLKDEGTFYSYDLEPFDLNYGQHASDSAFPHGKSPLPLNLYWGWSSAANDAHFRSEMVASVDRLVQVAKSEGIFDASQPVYPNYALARYSGEQLYGANTARLRAIRERVDPDNVMLLSGGFTI